MISPTHPLQRAIGMAERAILLLCSLCLLGMVILMNTEIFTRYALGFSIQIADEYLGYLFTAITMLCLAPALRENRFLRIESLVARMPAPIRAALAAVDALVGLLVCIVMTIATWQMVRTSHEFGAVSLSFAQTPLALPQALMPIGFVLLGLAYIAHGTVQVRQAWTGQHRASQQETPHVLD